MNDRRRSTIARMERRARYTRTWQNVVDNGGGGILRNAPGGFPTAGPSPQRVWKGSDLLAAYGFDGMDDGGYWTGSEGGWVTQNRTWSNPASLPAVGRATALISDPIAGLPWRLQRDRERLDLPAWLNDPQNLRGDPRFGPPTEDGMSAVDWRSQLVISLLWYGDGFIFTPGRGADGAPKPPTWILDPSFIETVGTKRARREDREPGHYIDDFRIPDEMVIHVRGQGPYDEDGRGLGVLTRYAVSYGLLGDIATYSGDLFGSGVPSGYLKVLTPNIADTQAEDLRQSWMDKHSGRGRGIAVLNSVTEFHPIAFSPVDAALIETKRLSMLDVALAFGVDPYKLGLPTDSNTYANVESRNLAFVQDTLLPWCRRIESGLDGEFPFGTALHVDLRGLLRADTATRVAAYHAALTDGWMTKDEVRDLEDLPPMTPAEEASSQPAPPLAVVPATPPQAIGA